ncbi:hypothetical protein GGTG_12541 [Gaeumannomyces tritici R3-111a-1]|uniref:Uncharacterized protein n=1 Tax=Gaeumannomyces tritici (strain R3-111a-1) TaxID=644352 RepID=J3PGB6_GAET3|nr:hypothetical protein GGTG_12541 [Gaeumannomyces tritici R3-111a-1]EJT69657.1 hypothetical protein GGTG_12541 [Gaeumannomyces tritici R3-111a-1]
MVGEQTRNAWRGATLRDSYGREESNWTPGFRLETCRLREARSCMDRRYGERPAKQGARVEAPWTHLVGTNTSEPPGVTNTNVGYESPSCK